MENDGLTSIIREFPCKGILVEPQHAAFASLQKRYADDPRISLENVAISDRDEFRDFYTIDCSGSVKLPWWTPQLASFHRDVIMRHRKLIPDLDRRIVRQVVECVTIPTLLQRCDGFRPDLLQIDTEGFDGSIIRSIDFSLFKPTIIRFEHKHLRDNETNDVVNILIQEGYRVGIAGEDAIAYLNY